MFQANLILIGPMGAGKSTVGRQLAVASGREFFDSDQEIERRCGVDIPLIFEKEGEAGFRSRERAVIAELSQRRGIVLATGGGAVLDANNRRHLINSGRVVYLFASVAEQLRRIGNDPNRPLLQTGDPYTRLAELLAQRDPLYRATADQIVITDQCQTRDIVAQILAQ